MSSDKSTINRKFLEQHGIMLSEDVYSPHSSKASVPGYVGNIIEHLLEHEVQVPNSLRPLFESERQQFSEIANADEYTLLPPATAFYAVQFREIEEREDKFEQVAKLARIAREYDASKVSTQAWEHFLRSYIFLSFEDSGMQISRHSKLFDAWSLETNISWNAVSKLNQISEDPPQPSLTYGFPLHVPDTGKTPTGLNRNELVTNFSLNTLADLGPIVKCPTTHPSTLKTRITEGQTPERKDLICFPWAFVEMQSATETVEACYCRAANGANAALDMQRQLQSIWATAKDIPPVIFFTCSGPEVRVWISFLELGVSKPSTRCICIWAGTLTATWCIVVLREIIQNMTFWAARVLKPQISSRISQIRPVVSASPVYPHGAIPFRNTASHKPPALEDTIEFKSGKLNLSAKGDSSSKQKTFVFGSSSNPPVKTEKSHTEDNQAAKTEKPVSSIESGFRFTEQGPSIIKPSDATVKIRKKTYVWYNGKRIPIRLPSNDERKPRRVTDADWNAKFHLWLRAHQAMISGQTALVDKQDASESGEAVAEISGGLQNLQMGQFDKAEANKKVEDKTGLEKSTPDSGEGKLETRKSPIVDAETQATQPGPSHTPNDKSLGKSNTGVGDSDEVDDVSFGEYFIYRTNESFHARRYDAAIWDSDGEDDQSYVPSVSSTEADSEDSDIGIEEDDADDEGSESASSNDYDDASIEELLSDLKIENERVDSSSASVLSPPGQVGNLTLAVIDDLLYTAANVISGGAFMVLHPIQLVFLDLKGADLLDATWRALENWEGKSPNLYSDQMRHLLETVKYLNDFVARQDDFSIDPFKHHHLTMGLRKDDLDQTLQRMQKNGDWILRHLLRSLLKSWDGEKCMEILSNELLEMVPDMFDHMLDEAFDVVYSDSNLLDTVR